MTCKEMESLLPGMIDGALPDQERKRIEAHLETCASCRKALADLRMSDEMVKGLEDVEPPPWLKTRVMAQVREEAGRKEGFLRKLFYPLHVKIPIQALATVLIAFVAWNVYKTGEPEFRQAAPPPAAMREVPKAQAPAAPATATGTAKEEGAAIKEKKAYAPPPAAVEDRMGRSAEVVRKAPKTDAAMPVRPSEAARVASVPQKDEEHQRGMAEAGRQEPDRAVPAPATEQRQKALKAPAGSVAKESAKREAAPSAPPMLSAAVPPHPDIEVLLLARDPVSASGDVEALLKKSDAQSVIRRTSEGQVTLTASVKPENLDVLREKLRSLGPVQEKALIAPRPGAPLNIRIAIRPE